MPPKNIEQTIRVVAKALALGVSRNLAHWTLIVEGWSDKQAAVMIRWAQQINKKENNNEDRK